MGPPHRRFSVGIHVQKFSDSRKGSSTGRAKRLVAGNPYRDDHFDLIRINLVGNAGAVYWKGPIFNSRERDLEFETAELKPGHRYLVNFF